VSGTYFGTDASPGYKPPGFRVSLVDSGGTYKVPVTINGQLTLQFVVDSGASDVTVPADVVLTLIRTESITETDFIGEQKYRLADGSTITSKTFRLKSLKVGDKTVENVTGSIADINGSLLLGQSFLRKFKSWSLDNSRHELVLE
jgi:clan AA aspartic protease (TIGR02281 family)